MNERIKALLLNERNMFVNGVTESNNKIYIHGSEENLEKFAELIVRECIGCCEQVISDPVPESVDTWLNGGEQCIVEIKTHFGVRE